MADVVPVALLAGLVGLDVVSFPQAMLSRPIVGAALGGALAGSPASGLVCGVALECLALESLPVGASRYPEWGSASVVAGALATVGATSQAHLPAVGAFSVAVLVGIVAAWIGGWTMVQHRQLIARVARPRLGQLAAGSRSTVIGLQVFGMTADLGRGTLLGALLYLVGHPVAMTVHARWRVPEDLTRAVVVTAVAAVAASAVWKDFHAISGTRRLFAVSLALGTLVVVLRA
ncbi:MAG: PTS sugar transporter subunit IIC [Gemmatimonas sp.]|uniref:PTS sugar transporter subunit IIC n=1 Tax=Gemmatimonas sp. TaxID=1962908 RepID=UPI00391F754F|nr:PTS sugar transporter subunit IIC [Gemmatimonadota bacterium]